MTEETRLNEWFVPKFGPAKFRMFVGLLFLPYTGMCISFAVIGSLLPQHIQWERTEAISLIYALALGISAHVADSIGSKKVKPWGTLFSKKQLVVIMLSSLVAAYSVGFYYILLYAPVLSIIAVLEGFFLIAYNFELFSGRFHNDFWFAVSWGTLPLLAGFIIQTNSVNLLAATVSVCTGIVSYAEIRLSRPYKMLMKTLAEPKRTKMLEKGLKSLSIGTITFGLATIAYRIIFS